MKRLLLMTMLLLAASAAAAYAYYTATGSGRSTAAVQTALPVTVSSATLAADLLPGGVGALTLKLTNPNSFPVRVAALELDTSAGTDGISVDSIHQACTAPALTVSRQTSGGAGFTVAANASSTLRLDGAVAMGLDAQNACQGATFAIFLRAATVTP